MLIGIKGAGDLASGIALRLYKSGFLVAMTDLEKPLAIRRSVSFCEAIPNGKAEVEGVSAHLATTKKEAESFINTGVIPVIPDPTASILKELSPDVIVDAIIAKRNTGTKIDDAKIVIAVGPGFSAGVDCHAVIESMRGHYLGRVIYSGCAIPNTNIPGLIGGFAGERVLRAPASGVFKSRLSIGDMVKAGDVAGEVNSMPMVCTIDGVLRGLIADGSNVKEGLKCGDVDPRGDISYCNMVSDKALAIAGGVLEAILTLSNVLKQK